MCTIRKAVKRLVSTFVLLGLANLPVSPAAQTPPDVEPAGSSNDKPFVCSAGRTAPHCHPLPATDFVWLLSEQGRPTADAVTDPHYAQLIDDLVPRAMFRYGYDMPLAQAFKTMLQGSTAPVILRAGRYLSLSTPAYAATAQGFLWVDLQLGVSFGAVFSHPTTGEPSPTEIVFSRQFSDEVLQESQLPAAFFSDLAAWETMHRIPMAARYFISSNGRSVLLHARDWCAGVDLRGDASAADVSADACQVRNEQTAEADLAATYFLALRRYADDPATRTDLERSERQWVASRNTSCRSDAAGTDCRVKMTRARAITLQHMFTISLDN